MKEKDRLPSLTVSVCAEWRMVCLMFLQTGNAPEEFLAHLESCSSCQAVVDKNMRDQAKLLEQFGRELRRAR